MVLTLALNQGILWAELALFLLYFFIPYPTVVITFPLSLSLLSFPPPGTTALYGKVSAMVSLPARGRAVSPHCALLLGKREVLLLFSLGGFC